MVAGYFVFLIIMYLIFQRCEYSLFKKGVISAIRGLDIRIGSKQDRFEKSRVYKDNLDFFEK